MLSISNLTSGISNLISGAQATGQAVGTATSIYTWFTSLHLSATALLIIAALLFIFGGKVAKGVVYLVAFIMIILALIGLGIA